MRATLVALTLALSCAAVSADETLPQAAPKVSLQAGGESLRVTLHKISTAARTPIRVDPVVPDVPVRLNLRDVTADHALRLVVRQASRHAQGLQYEASGEGFRVFIRTPAEPLPEEDPNRVTITIRKPPPPPPTTPELPSTKAPSGEGAATPELAGAGHGSAQWPTGGAPGLQGQRPSSIYLVEPVAPYFLRSPFGIPDYRPGLLIPGIPGRKGRQLQAPRKNELPPVRREHIWVRIEPMHINPLNPYQTRPPQRKRKPTSQPGDKGPGGVGQRPL